MYRITDHRQVTTPKHEATTTEKMRETQTNGLETRDKPNRHNVPLHLDCVNDNMGRRGAVSEASTTEPLENRFDHFPDQCVTGRRKMSLHPNKEAEIIAEMKRNKNKQLVSPDEEEKAAWSRIPDSQGPGGITVVKKGV